MLGQFSISMRVETPAGRQAQSPPCGDFQHLDQLADELAAIVAVVSASAILSFCPSAASPRGLGWPARRAVAVEDAVIVEDRLWPLPALAHQVGELFDLLLARRVVRLARRRA